ncbi:Zwei Ig domain protein zig-8-like 15 [Homarus americanus]|uniref:Zwei Ig domain protein zig-8-like 15 n=1 Tax=Homarus americanus TaxID=6706 RepID=A0A8J5MU70_HOMAM|nr:Zwei Ig domain protein zig-8-like 15 [Homarus americanus]
MKVTWLRRRDLHILTAGHHTYSADQRFQLSPPHQQSPHQLSSLHQLSPLTSCLPSSPSPAAHQLSSLHQLQSSPSPAVSPHQLSPPHQQSPLTSCLPLTSSLPSPAVSPWQVVHAEGSQEWTLVVRYTQLRDAGVYECQVNTEPKLSRHVTLRVHGNLRVEILGPRELYIEEGSSLTLTCLVTSLRGPSALVYWYHDISLIDYNSPRGGVNLKIDRGRGETTTRLVVSSVGPGDSGMYSCVPQGSHPATVLVHVQKGEHEAAIQQGGLNVASSATSFSSPLFLLSCLLLLHVYLIPSTSELLLHSSSIYSSIVTILIILFSSPSSTFIISIIVLCLFVGIVIHCCYSFSVFPFTHNLPRPVFMTSPPSLIPSSASPPEVVASSSPSGRSCTLMVSPSSVSSCITSVLIPSKSRSMKSYRHSAL